MAFSKIFLSGYSAAEGGRILVSGISPSTAITVHTAITTVATDGGYDEVYIYARSHGTGAQLLTVRFGVSVANATTAGVEQTQIRYRVTNGSGAVLVVPGWPLAGGRVVEAFATGVAAATGGLALYGHVHRLST